MTQLEKIKALVKYLPGKDIKYAEKFISKRDFKSLEEIVTADVKKLNIQLSKLTLEELKLPENEELSKKLTKLRNLEFEVDLYCSQLMLDDEEF